MPVNIEKIEKEVQELYSPTNAFGNKELLTKMEIIANLRQAKDARDKCDLCDSDGMITQECEECSGTGELEVPCDHEN